MKIKFTLLFLLQFFSSIVFCQTFNSNLDYDIAFGCSDSLDVTIDLSNENLPNLDGSQFGLVEVCINIDHSWLADLDLFLSGPMGITVELTTDNGQNGNNYDNTCFSMNGSNGPVILGMAPMTGSYIPEGNLNDFNNNHDPNGVWELILCDDGQGFSGTITNWSMTFGMPMVASCSVLDSFILAEFYQRQGGDEWIENEGWLAADVSYMDWYGVEVDQNGCVTKLNLGANNLTGPIYRELDLLSELVKIDFQNNQLTDSLPSSLSNLEFLDSLDLSNNINLNGAYPDSYLQFCNISYSNFSGTSLSDFSTFCNFVSLTETTAGSSNLFPNPFSEILNIETTTVIKSIRLYNSSGALIQVINDQITSIIDLSHLINGMYFIEMIAEDEVRAVHKVIKI